MSTNIIPPLLCPCENVRRTSRMVMEENVLTKIMDDKLKSLAKEITQQTCQVTEWDAEGWHYIGDSYKGQGKEERVALYILALDAINFCFWPHPTMKASNTLEYDHLAVALKKLAEEDDGSGTNESYFFRPENLSRLTIREMEERLKPYLAHYLPNMAERCRLWNELGEVLIQSFEGSAIKLIASSGYSATSLVKKIVDNFPGFRDETIWRGKWVAFYKRAQIVVGDLNAALKLNLKNLDQLTTFADYRVPQVLRHWGVLKYSEELSKKVDTLHELHPDEEIGIRAATIICVDKLVHAVNNLSKKSSMNAVKIDWFLWQIGEKLNIKGDLKPHHRVKTIFY